MLNMNRSDKLPHGFKLQHSLRGHTAVINWITWSSDGEILASSSSDNTIRLWNPKTGQLHRMMKRGFNYSVAWSPDRRLLASGGSRDLILWNVETGVLSRTINEAGSLSVAWSPDGKFLASSNEGTISLWNPETGECLSTLIRHSTLVRALTWSPDGQRLAAFSDDGRGWLWEIMTGSSAQTLSGHTGRVYSAVWSPDGKKLASSSSDLTIRIWNPQSGRSTNVLEGHTESVICISFSSDGRLLASKAGDGTVRLWRTDNWATVATLDEPSPNRWYAGMAFHPKEPVLATMGDQDKAIRIWDLNLETVLGNAPVAPLVYYTNAKVVLVGETGVGKTGLALVLTQQPYVPTDSTHGRHIWTFDSQEAEVNDGHKEMRETFLWDLAGQPGYRLIHQLHLNEVAVALVVFDARSEIDPFAGIHHWNRALRQALRIQGHSAPLMKKLLVAARIDRGGSGISRGRIESLVHELDFDGYLETSAKEGWGIADLAQSIRELINWKALPRVSSTNLFQRIKDFLIEEKAAGRLLSKADDLYHMFLKTQKTLVETEELRIQFETCIRLLESRDLIRRFSFGDLVLLQPELLDVYAAALVNAVKDEPDGLGSITEERAQLGDFRIPIEGRIKDKEQEKLLLIAMVEDLLHHEIVLREPADDGIHLIFPSQSTRANPDLPAVEEKTVIFHFEGPILNIYATLAVRLSHSGFFQKKDLWKDAVTYTAKVGGTCGMFLYNIGEGRGELTLFFDKAASEETRFQFEEYISTHLQRRALPESIQRQRIFICPQCKTLFTREQVTRRRQSNHDWIRCSVCDTQVSLLDREERLKAKHRSLVSEMDHAANTQREIEATASVFQGRREIGDFDVFLCYNHNDKALVKEVGERLKQHKILPWLDEWELRPGLPWQRALEEQIELIKSAAVFVGREGIGPWQQEELEAFLREFVKRGCPVIPILLENAPKKPQLPIFLEGRTWVDFRKQDPNPMEQLLWGITGKHGFIR